MSTPFAFPYDLSALQALDAAQFNAAMTQLETFVNGLQSRIDALAAPTAPNLSGYATTSQLLAHSTANSPHSGFLVWMNSEPLFGVNLYAGQVARVQTVAATISTSPTAVEIFGYTNGILAVQVTATSGPEPVSVEVESLTQLSIDGTEDTEVTILVIGH